MKPTIAAPFPTERHALHARSAAATAAEATRYQSPWQGWVSWFAIGSLRAESILAIDTMNHAEAKPVT